MLAILTDSTADLPADLSAALDIHIVPAVLVMNGQPLRDGPDIDRDEFYRRLPGLNPLPTTAAPASGEFEAAYESLLRHADHVLSIHAAAALSGIYNAACAAAQSFAGRVSVEDSEQISLGLGFQVLAAAESVRTLAAALAAARATRARVRVFALLDTLQNLRRSGRVSFLQAGLGDFLQIKLLVELTRGQVLRLAQARTRRTAIETLLAQVRALGPLARLAVLHAGAPDEAADLSAQLASQSALPPLVGSVTSVIGTHVGPRALGVVAVTEAKPET